MSLRLFRNVLLNFQIFGSILIFVLSFLLNVTVVKKHTPDDFNPLKLLRIALHPAYGQTFGEYSVSLEKIVQLYVILYICYVQLIKEISAKVVVGTGLEWGVLPLYA